jgi:hypothetical protein
MLLQAIIGAGIKAL